MAALSNSILIHRQQSIRSTTVDQCARFSNLSFSCKVARKPSPQRRALNVQASYSDDGRSSCASFFVGGFILGGLFVGTLGCIYAPQISKAVTDTDKKELMKKLPKFIYDEEKAIEKQRRKLAEKIEQINSAIDNVSNQWRPKGSSDESATGADEIEAFI